MLNRDLPIIEWLYFDGFHFRSFNVLYTSSELAMDSLFQRPLFPR